MHNVFMTSGMFRSIFGCCTCDAAGVVELYFDKLFEAEEHGSVFFVGHCPWQLYSEMQFSFWRRIKFMKHDFSSSDRPWKRWNYLACFYHWARALQKNPNADPEDHQILGGKWNSNYQLQFES
jgi:hypothetical protein